MVVDVVIKRRVAMALHFVFSGMGILVSVFLAYQIGMIKLAMIQFGCGGLLWFYSTNFKKQFLIGNIIIGFLTALTVLVVGIYEIVPALTSESLMSSRGLFLIIAGYSVFAFISTLIREIVKDLEDLKGDKQMGYKTLAISFGERKARSIAILLSLVMLLLIIILSYRLFKDALPQLIYITSAIILPLLYLIYVLSYAHEKKDYSRSSNLLKLLMLTGMFSMLAFQLLEKYA
jgi:4-hydroxybenzoate polyprenyltransferase